ncbi:hypothetical protein SLA2020_414370 [Shorea laevis]
MEFWTTTCLSFIASGVGKPLCADSTTEEQRRLGFARVLVEVNTESDFPKEIEIINSDGLPVNIGVEYPWLPVQCKTCKSFGHATHAVPKWQSRLGFRELSLLVGRVIDRKFP